MTDDTFPQVDDDSVTQPYQPTLLFLGQPIRVPATAPVPDRSVVDELETVVDKVVRL